MAIPIKNSDLDRMQTLGRLVGSEGDAKALEEAASYLAITRLEGGNFTRLWIWFEEGARNTVEGQHHLDDVKRVLKRRAEEIYEGAM